METHPRRSRRWLALAVVLAIGGGVFATDALAALPSGGPPCVHRVLVVSAMPLELNPLVAKAKLDPNATVHVNDRTFYVGQLAGNEVVLAITGIGLRNAEETTRAAFEHFRCSFKAAVFSGVAGSKDFIGDVDIPERWTRDGGKTWIAADPAMVAAARPLQTDPNVKLARDVPVGDAACLCPGVDAPTPVRLPQVPKVRVGGNGTSADQFGGHAVPCVPGGGDVAGCEPCILSADQLNNAANFAANAPELADTGFWSALLQPPEQTTGTYASQDEETAAFGQVARQYGVPFLGVRAVSDGQGDPLHLPGFPAQFFVYRQLAGNNAATVTMAFLQSWAARGRPTA